MKLLKTFDGKTFGELLKIEHENSWGDKILSAALDNYLIQACKIDGANIERCDFDESPDVLILRGNHSGRIYWVKSPTYTQH